jgi:hypothetical protein
MIFYNKFAQNIITSNIQNKKNKQRYLFLKYFIEYCRAQSTYIYRVPQCMSPRRNWDSPTPSLASECAPPPGTKEGGGHTRLLVRGWSSPNSDDWRKGLALCLLCAVEA